MFRFLSLTGAICLSSCAASLSANTPTSEIIDSHNNAHLQTIYLPCTDCAFSGLHCSQNTNPNNYLTVDFSIENDALFANSDPIFPSSIPMQFDAVQNGKSGQSLVVITYALNARPLPPSVEGNDAYYLLTLKLFDLHGHQATTEAVSIDLIRDADGNLSISNVETNPASRVDSWRTEMKYWETQFNNLFGSKKEAAANLDRHRPNRPNTPSLYHNHYPWSSREHNFLRLIRPIIMPALLGVSAGMFACLIGFLVGKVAISLYFCYQDHRKGRNIPVIVIEDGTLQEKGVDKGRGTGSINKLGFMQILILHCLLLRPQGFAATGQIEE